MSTRTLITLFLLILTFGVRGQIFEVCPGCLPIADQSGEHLMRNVLKPPDVITETTNSNSGAFVETTMMPTNICTYSLISPNGGESWSPGSTQAVRWSRSGSNCALNVRLYLYNDGVLNRTLTGGTPNDGLFSWKIPVAQATRSIYRIKVEDRANNTYGDQSDNTFSILAEPGCNYFISSPHGGESWLPGSTQSIKWGNNGNDCALNVRLYLYKGGLQDTRVSNGTPNDGLFSWNIPAGQTHGSDYRIKVEDRANSAYSAQSDKYFAIDTDSKRRASYQHCTDCPLMVDIPGGSFQMGDISGVGFDEELPVHPVTVPAFAMGVYEVTFDEWDTCYIEGGCSQNADDEGWGRGTRPVVNVSWFDAQEYVTWLRGVTGKQYRLPSESRWEYATRAGTTTDYWWGNGINCSRARFGDQTESRFHFCDAHGSVAVDSYSPSPFGLSDVHGNVWEWVEDCRNDWYHDAPADGDPWLAGDCSERPLRGGSWYSRPTQLRSAYRARNQTDARDNRVGFRVALNLTTPGSQAPGCIYAVSSPGGGESWLPGSTRSILWSTSGSDCALNVRLHLYKDGILDRTLSGGRPNDGSFGWKIPASQAAGSDYTIKVEDRANGIYGDQSDNNFSITAGPDCDYSISSPNGGESWLPGSTQSIEWSTSGRNCALNVRLHLYKGGILDRTLAGGRPNDGSFGWKIPVSQAAGSDYTIKVEDRANSTYSDQSDNDFSITVGPVCDYLVSSPNGGESWLPGSTQSIEWSSSGSDCALNVRLHLYKDGILDRTLAGGTPNDGSFGWKIPASQAAGSGYTIKVEDRANSTYSDQSDNDFSIKHHSSRWMTKTDSAFHGTVANQEIVACTSCHGSHLEGGPQVSCETCHGGWKTDCVFCHGGYDNMLGSPPTGVNGETERSFVEVGAHTAHVEAPSSLSSPLDCDQCHVVPVDALSAGHIDGSPAEVNDHSWDHVNETCYSASCHGAFTGGNPGNQPAWTDTSGTAANCGSCHDLSPMTGRHPSIFRKHASIGRDCTQCHQGVTNNGATSILDPKKHINGVVEVNIASGSWNASTKSCNPSCHGSKKW